MANYDARKQAIESLETARALMLEAAEFEFRHNATLDKADDHILDVLDQLSHFCSPHARLYSSGEPWPVGSRLRYALRILTSAGSSLLARRK